MYNVCSVPWGIHEYREGYLEYDGGVQYRGGYLEYRWAFQHRAGDIISTVGDILSTVGNTQYHGRYHDACGGTS